MYLGLTSMLITTFYKLCLYYGIEAVQKEAFEIILLENSPVNVKGKEEKCEIGKLSASKKQG